MPAREMHPPWEILLAGLIQWKEQQKKRHLADVTEEEWQEVLALSMKQGVAALLYRQLEQSESGLSIPQPITARLRNAYLASAADAMRLYRQIEAVLRRLHVEGIRVIPLKGIYLAEKVYGNIGLRPMADVDLLIERQNLARSVELMADLGYRPAYPFKVEQECRDVHHLPGLFASGGVHLELHWNLIPPGAPFRISIDQIWEEAKPGTLAGEEVLEMHPEDLLLYLCLHTAYAETFNNGLGSICDLAWTMRTFQDAIDWDRLWEKARSWGAERSLFLALQVTQSMLGTAPPGGFLERIQPASYEASMESWAIQQVFEPAEMGGKLAQVWSSQPWLQRGRRFIRNLFPPGWEMRSAYPRLAKGILWPAAYLNHLGIVLGRNWQAFWRLLSRDNQMLAAARQRDAINKMLKWQEE